MHVTQSGFIFRSPDVMMNVKRLVLSLTFDDDLPANMIFDKSKVEAIPTHARARTRTIRGIKLAPTIYNRGNPPLRNF